MEIKKSYWVSNGDNLSLTIPFAKVDKERRMVSGFATLDNVDSQGDLVDTAASLTAFTRFRGNIREMHQPIAVGKVLSFKQQDFYDKSQEKSYSGVFVDVYVSKGAQDTWEKVLDGTLSGFSIGGNINKYDTVIGKDNTDGPVRVIKDYDLVELSLVDNPANELANVFSIQKSDIGFNITGMATTVKTQTVFYCESDEIAVAEDSESRNCDMCETTMKNIGWVEDSSDISKIVDQYIVKNISKGKGGNEMAEKIIKSAEEVEETVADQEVAVDAVQEAEVAAPEAENAEEVAEVVEKSANTEEAPQAEDANEEDADFAKMLDDLKSVITDGLAKAADSTGASVASVEEIINRMKSDITKSVDDMSTRHEEMSKAVEDCKRDMSVMKDRVDALETASAMKKSNDLASGSMETTKKSDSIWKGHFLGVQDL